MQTYWLIQCWREHTTHMQNFHSFPKFHGLIPVFFILWIHVSHWKTLFSSKMGMSMDVCFGHEWQKQGRVPPTLDVSNYQLSNQPHTPLTSKFRNTIWLSSSKAPDDWFKSLFCSPFCNSGFHSLSKFQISGISSVHYKSIIARCYSACLVNLMSCTQYKEPCR